MAAAAMAGTGGLLVLAGATVLWAFSVRWRDASVADIAWGPGFALLAWTYVAWQPVATTRALWLAFAVTLWAARLAWHIARRHRGEDRRYRALREAAGPSFWWRSLFTVFWLQGVLLWIIAAPFLAVAHDVAAPLRWQDLVGGLLILLGGTLETVADAQLTRFRRTSSPGEVLDTGLWRYSRHPNYFGDAVFWWGVFIVASATPFGRLTIVAPVVMTWLLVRVSGVALLDRTLAETKPAYRDYIARTSAFVLWPPRSSSANASQR